MLLKWYSFMHNDTVCILFLQDENGKIKDKKYTLIDKRVSYFLKRDLEELGAVNLDRDDIDLKEILESLVEHAS